MAHIISLHAYRHASGKSSIAANLAAQLAMMGKRVGLVDTDIQDPGIYELFGLQESMMPYTLNQFLHGECGIEEVVYSIGDLTDDAPGRGQLKGKAVWLLPASPNQDEIRRILQEGYDVNLLNRGLQTLHKTLNLNYLLIDTRPGLNDETLLSVAVSDSVILVLRPNQRDFQGTAVTLDVIRSLDAQNPFLLINKLLKKYDPAKSKAQVEEKYGTPVLAILPFSEDLLDDQDDLFSLSQPDDTWSQRIKDAAKKLVALFER